MIKHFLSEFTVSQKNKIDTKAKKTKPTHEKTEEVKNVYTGEIVTCILALPTIFILISLSAYYSGSARDDFFTGSFGYYCAQRLDNLFGIVSFYIPIAVIAFVIIFFLKKQLWKHILLNAVNFVALLPFFSMIIDTYSSKKVNYTGHLLYQDFFGKVIGKTGFILLFSCWMILFIILTFHVSFVRLCAKLSVALKEYFSMKSTDFENVEAEKTVEEPEHSDPNYIDLTALSKEIAEEEPQPEPEVAGIPLPEEFEDESFGEEETPENEIDNEIHENIEENEQKQEEAEEPEQESELHENNAIEVKTSDINESKTSATVLRKLKDYHLPPLSLLVEGENIEKSKQREDEVAKTCLIIARKLGEHKIKVEVKGATIGPLVTMYEIELGEGVKVSHVLGMEADLTVAVSGKKVRIVGFIPGKPYIGIEVPNDERLTIRLKSILESPEIAEIAPDLMSQANRLPRTSTKCRMSSSQEPREAVNRSV